MIINIYHFPKTLIPFCEYITIALARVNINNVSSLGKGLFPVVLKMTLKF